MIIKLSQVMPGPRVGVRRYLIAASHLEIVGLTALAALRSMWFELDPLPDGMWDLYLKNEKDADTWLRMQED